MQFIDATNAGNQDAVQAYHLMQEQYDVADDLLLAAIRAAVDVLGCAEGGCTKPEQLKCTAVRICRAMGELQQLREEKEQRAYESEKSVAPSAQTGPASPESAECPDQ